MNACQKQLSNSMRKNLMKYIQTLYNLCHIIVNHDLLHFFYCGNNWVNPYQKYTQKNVLLLKMCASMDNYFSRLVVLSPKTVLAQCLQCTI